jgi:hypothetical protein
LCARLVLLQVLRSLLWSSCSKLEMAVQSQY